MTVKIIIKCRIITLKIAKTKLKYSLQVIFNNFYKIFLRLNKTIFKLKYQINKNLFLFQLIVIKKNSNNNYLWTMNNKILKNIKKVIYNKMQIKNPQSIKIKK